MAEKLTKYDIARICGVSHMTVSRVLNKQPYVREAVRREILEVCRKHNYHPSILATSLRSKKTRAIGVILGSLGIAFSANLLRHIEERCIACGYHIFILQGGGKGSRKFLEWPQMQVLLARQIDGLIIGAEMDPAVVGKLEETVIPTVFIDKPDQECRFPFVGTDDVGGARTMTEFLVDAGHRTIAFCAGQRGDYTSDSRIAGYRAALKTRNIPFRSGLVVHTRGGEPGGYSGFQHLVPGKAPCTAIFTANDYIAVGILSAAHRRGIRVPGDLSVAGFTGDPVGAFVIPPLTTMEQPVQKLAVAAVELLFRRMQNPAAPTERILLPARLLKRESVAAPPADVLRRTKQATS